MYNGSAYSASTWGHQAAAISELQIIQLEREALACTGIKPSGRCRAIALLVAFGLNATPRARIIRETIRDYLNILANNSSVCVTNTTGCAWIAAVKKLRENNNSTKYVTGIMSNVILILLKAGWSPNAFNCWSDPSGTVWTLTNNSVSPDIVSSEIIKSYFAFDLARADNHYDGKGMKDGIHRESTLKKIRSFGSNDKLYKDKCTLETVMSSCCWSNDRIHSIFPSHNPRCNRCGLNVPETELHCYRECPANTTIAHEAVTSTQPLIPRAQAECDMLPCLWLRGLLPASLIQAIIPASDDLAVSITSPDLVSWKSGTYYGDASGGIFSSHNDLRRCGCSVVKCDELGGLIFACDFPLPGEIQTVPLLSLIHSGSCRGSTLYTYR